MLIKRETGIGLNYQSIGSGGGIKQIKAKTVTFGASDQPLKPEELEEAGLIQFPMIMGGAVPVANLKGVAPGQLKIDGPTLADIYMGKVTKWNDAAIAKLNPGVKLPSTAIATDLSFRRLGHQLPVHHLSLPGQRALQRQDRRQYVG